MRHKATAKNITKVMRRFADFLDDNYGGNDPGLRTTVSESLNELLDSLVCEDVFGTEAQCDPRGDQRC